MACETERAQLAALQAQLVEMQKEIASETKQDQSTFQSSLKAMADKVSAASAALANCLAPLQPQRIPGAQPANILGTNAQTPAFGGPWASTRRTRPTGPHRLQAALFPVARGLNGSR